MRPALQPLLEALEVLADQDLSRPQIAARLERVEGLMPLLCRFAGGRPPGEVRMDALLARYGLRRFTEGLERMARRLSTPPGVREAGVPRAASAGGEGPTPPTGSSRA